MQQKVILEYAKRTGGLTPKSLDLKLKTNSPQEIDKIMKSLIKNDLFSWEEVKVSFDPTKDFLSKLDKKLLTKEEEYFYIKKIEEGRHSLLKTILSYVKGQDLLTEKVFLVNEENVLDSFDGLEDKKVKERLSFVRKLKYKILKEKWEDISTVRFSVPFILDLSKKFEETASEKAKKTISLINMDINKNRNYLISSNLRLVTSIASKYRHVEMELLDLIQEGNIGLVKAIEKFDYRKDVRFSTYATWWVRQVINRAISNKGKAVRVPVHVQEMASKINKAEKKLIEKGKEVNVKQIAKTLKVSRDKVESAMEAKKSVLSLNVQAGEEEGRTFLEMVEDLNQNQEEQFLQEEANHILAQELQNLLSIGQEDKKLGLSFEEYTVLKHRFGLEGCNELTLEEVGLVIGKTRERARQIEASALNKMKNNRNLALCRDSLF